MRKYFCPLTIVLLLQCANPLDAQQAKFNQVINANITSLGGITCVAQDRQGYIWFSAGLGGNITGHGGLYRYDGSKLISFSHDLKKANSLASNWAECVIVDSSNMVWIGTYGAGLDRYDPSTGRFTHFHHDPKNGYSLANDTVTALLEDHKGNIWAGTYGGLDLLDKKTGRFTHYAHDPNNKASLSYNHVRVIYEDRQGTLWVGCGAPFPGEDGSPEAGGLNRFNVVTGTFTRYLHDPADPGSIANNKIRALLEDSKGQFWVGTAGDGLHIMDRSKGTFTHYYYDSTHPEKLSRPPLYKNNSIDHVTFIKEDIKGNIWIGTFLEGMNRYDPVTKKITHYGLVLQNNRTLSNDTATGFNEYNAWSAFTSRDGLLWISSTNGNLYNINLLTTVLPYYNLNHNANSFYKEPGSNILWIATENGLLRRDLANGIDKEWHHDPLKSNSLCNDTIGAMRIDNEGKFWLSTGNGLSKYDPISNDFTTYRHDEKDRNSLSSNFLNNVFIDHDKNIWIATVQTGLDKLNPTTNEFENFKYSSKDTNTICSNSLICINEDKSHRLWVGTYYGMSSLNTTTMKWGRYLQNSRILAICVDAKDIVWAGTSNGLYYFDNGANDFVPYSDLSSETEAMGVLHILEDNKHNLWVTTVNSIVKINEQRNEIKSYGPSYGVHKNLFFFADNTQSWDGQLFFGDLTGYYSFNPDKFKDNNAAPLVSFSSFKLGDEEVKPGVGSVLRLAIWDAKEIQLKYNQNIFSMDFIATHYSNPGELKYLFMLENYDNTWHSIGTDHTAYFFNVPAGKYIFHAKAVNADGMSGERTISIVISPPWWKTWWAYSIYAICFLAVAFFANRFIRNRIIEKERTRSREKELAQAKEIEKAYKELKSTQAQLIQSEKMASLGELTAGIAHEIQNPLNFVNNFSEVNKELIDEMQKEMEKGNLDEAKAISNNIRDNEEKIMSHGKRADAIVKGMLQHSRISSGQKELTDINALCDEYLRLSYHGLRAKNKSFNSKFETVFDPSVQRINIVPQEIGRVILNLINNAFYAVSAKASATADRNYESSVTVTTKNIGENVLISVTDNGNGIPAKNLDKIFQPFFTTKPTGQGTGLGLSLAYDIIKSHGGELKVESKEDEFTRFIVQLPKA